MSKNWHSRQIRCVSTSGTVQPKKAVAHRRASSFEPRIAQAFGAVIRTERVKRRVAQDAFALAAGIDRSYYGKLERGERQPSIALLLRIAIGLDCSAATLIRRLEAALNDRDGYEAAGEAVD